MDELSEKIQTPLYGKQYGTEHLFMCLLENKTMRDSFLIYLHKKGINCSVHYKPVHRMAHYKNKYKLKDKMFPRASDLGDREITLPLYPALTNAEQKRIIKEINKALG